MLCLIEKGTNRIVQDAILDSGKWLGQGVVCWAPCLYCNEGDEDQEGYYTAEIDEDELWDVDDDGWNDERYYIDGQVCTSAGIEEDDDEQDD